MNDLTGTPEPTTVTVQAPHASVLAEIRESQERLFEQMQRLHELVERQLALLDVAYLSIKHAAKIVELSDSHIRHAVTSGDLPASNVGTARRPIYRIGKTDLAAWLEGRKRGGRPLGRSALQALIEEQLPGMSRKQRLE